VNGDPVNLAVLWVTYHGVYEVHGLPEYVSEPILSERKAVPEIVVNPDFHTHTSAFGTVNVLFKANTPSITRQTLSSLNHHIPYQLTMVHQCST
jgi:hypothetical protein